MHRPGAGQRLRRRHLAPLGRDRGYVHRRFGRRHRRRADQDGQRIPQRADREVQPVVAHQRGAGRRGELPRTAPVRLVTRTRVVGIAGGLGLLALAVWGGEYGTADWITIRRQLTDERAKVAALRIELDSLAKLAHDLETNPAVQERVAREQFGVIRDGEVLYRVVPPPR
ncbi:MAG: hypothetical protein DMD54_00280 [Gemmatimonadetes bacterium]|nr:MAG: hypothetical protein DMD54_00280 [Gemmatimonadota bacterium]